jgi:hypothetical protein
MTELFGISRGAYYKWFGGSDKRQARADAEKGLMAIIRKIVEENKHRYGAPRILVELRETYGIPVREWETAVWIRQDILQVAWDERNRDRDNRAYPKPGDGTEGWDTCLPIFIFIENKAIIKSENRILCLHMTNRLLRRRILAVTSIAS